MIMPQQIVDLKQVKNIFNIFYIIYFHLIFIFVLYTESITSDQRRTFHTDGRKKKKYKKGKSHKTDFRVQKDISMEYELNRPKSSKQSEDDIKYLKDNHSGSVKEKLKFFTQNTNNINNTTNNIKSNKTKKKRRDFLKQQNVEYIEEDESNEYDYDPQDT